MINNKIIIGISLGLVFIGIIVFVDTIYLTDVQAQLTGRNTLYVGGPGPGNYTYIQDAIDDANDGDTVFIYTGTYHERIAINQTITLMGEERSNTTINGTFGGTYGTVVKIYADGVYMQNLTVMESGGDMEDPQVGIRIYGSFTSIYNCTITHNWDGICLHSGSQKNLIFNCSVIYCSLFAIDIDVGCSDTIISQCNFSYHYYGIHSCGQNNIIEKCIFTMTSCCISISVDGRNNTIRHCELIGGTGVEYFGLAVQYGRIYNCTIDGYPYGVWPGSQTTVEECRIINNYYGIDADLYANDSIFLDCMISLNTIGINAESTGNLTIYNCTVTENIENGINLDGCHQIDISHCHISQNNWGIHITGGTGNNGIKYCDIFNNENGIHMSETNNNLIGRCNLYNHNVTGIMLFYSNNNTISSSTVTNNTRYGIELYKSHNNTLINNTAISNHVGIYLCSSSTNTLTNNTFINDGLFVYLAYNNQVQNNIVNGKSLIYLEDAKNYSVTNAGQVILVNCTNITVNNLNLSRTTVGIELWETSNNTIKNNTVSFNLYGIYLESSHTNILTSNTINNNTYGISLESSHTNVLTGNTINNNNYSIAMSYSHTNTLTNNTINNNTYGISLSSSSINNTLTTNTITNNFHGIYLYFSSNNNTLINNTVNNNFHGIYLVFSSNNNSITTNTITNNTGYGISLYSSSTNTLTANTITHNEYGIYLDSSTNTLTANTISNNEYGIALHSSSSNNILTSNIITTNEYGIYLAFSSNNNIISADIVTNNLCGIKLNTYSNNNTLSNCQIYSNDVFGVCLNPSSNNKILQCNISYNGNGIMTYGGVNNQILNCIISSNYNNGIWLFPPTPLKSLNQENGNDVNIYLSGNRAYYDIISHCNITDNNCGIKVDYVNWNTICYCNISDNDLGIHLNDYADNNTLYLNNFWGNTNNALSSNNSNVWHSPQPLYYIYSGQQHTSYLGNYWDDYLGYDTNGDGIGEMVYQIDNNDYDYYPLCTSWTYYHILNTFSLPLYQGWNMITVPFDNSWTAETLGQNISGCTTVCRFNASSQTYVTHVIGIPYNDFSIVDGSGYFVYCTHDNILGMPGLSITSVNVSIFEDWNLVGWHHEYTTTAESLGENISGTTVGCMFNAETQSFTTHVVGIPYNNFPITKGMALFIYTIEASYWHGEG